MDIKDGFTGTVGNTPLIRLRKASEITGCTILGKAEFLNPGGSVKDRAALYMILDAEERGALGKGGVIVEGIGLGLVTANVDGAPIDDAFQIPDEEALPVCFDLLADEGLCLGGSSGINVAGAIRLARRMGPGKTIVTVLCDSGTRYLSKLYNPDFLRGRGLPVPDWL